ncbi:MAG: PPOX class F420-dependent oxidoreductase [Acidimicrobiia bacterium]
MDVAAGLDFVLDHHRAILSTRRRDGAPQMSPVACGVQDGQVVISSRETAMKVKNLRRDPRAALCVFTDDFFGAWVQLDGRASIQSLPEAMEPLVDYYRSAAGEHPDWEEYRAAMDREQRLLIRITVERAGPDVSG